MTNEKRLIDLLIAARDLTTLSRKADFLIANDVVPVVRCRDCRKCSTYDDVITGQKQYICRLWHGATREVDEDSFCSAGERKDNVQ